MTAAALSSRFANMVLPRRVRRRRRRRAGKLLALGILLVIVVGLVSGSALLYSTVKAQAGQLQAELTTHLEVGQRDLEAAKSSLVQANSAGNAGLITQAKVQLVTAKLQFVAASQIADTNQLLRRLETVPDVGDLARSRHTAVDAVAEMGIALCDAGQELADLDGQLLKPAGGGQAARTLLTVLEQTQGALTRARQDFARAQAAADRVDIRVLPASQTPAFQRALGSIAKAKAGIDEFEQLVPVLTEVLGGNGPRTYLVEQVNPAELRPGGGFIGTYSVMRADGGTLALVRSGNASELVDPRPAVGQPGYVVPPGPLKEFVPSISWSFLDSNFFADFPSNARTAEDFVQPRVGTIDGVISMDYYTVAKMLELTGPLAVPGYPITVDAGNFIPTVVQYDIDAATDPAANQIHKAILSALAGSLMQRLSAFPPSKWPALITAFNDLAASHHLQTYFNNAAVENQMQQFGWSGALKTDSAKDFMMEVESNLGGTKANYFVTRHYSVILARNGNTLYHRVTVDITDNMPFSYRPGEYYRAYIRLLIGAKATTASDDLVPPLYPSPSPPPGTQALDGWMSIHGYGHDRVVVFDYDTPWQPNGRGEEQIYWQKQPGTLNDAVDITWDDGLGHAFKVSGDLGQDRVITLSPRGVTFSPGQSGSAKLPGLSLG